MAIDRIEWAEFESNLLWYQGEHVSLIGPTGGGKTTLALSLLKRRKLAVILCTKPKDTTITGFQSKNREYRRLTNWSQRHERDKRVILWPPCRSVEDQDKQRQVMRAAIREIFQKDGCWCIMADEIRYLCKNLGLEREFNLLWLQGRSLDISLVSATQRPAWVPLEMYSQATHLFFWQNSDRRDLQRLGGLGGISPKVIVDEVESLAKHEVLYVNTRDRTMYRTIMEVK
jgi:hypothetical protein